ncbi:MAG TPA: sulfatase-like hydrolase/transferase [Thermoanaerobaculia bacterium]|nr:sulfatase-like hydrolase/transferase [Thermoanaerobaculia bacterium]
MRLVRMGRGGGVAGLGLAITSLVPASCARGPESQVFPGAPIVLISIDTLRSDHLPAYGYRGVATPAIDGLRRDALLFERAYSHYPMTLPSHVSILSGELPPVHGVRDNVGYRFDAEGHPYLPRLLKVGGYETGAFVSASVLQAETGVAAGFDTYDDHFGEATPDEPVVERPGSETVRLALEWVERQQSKPFFLFVHLYEPHAPYHPPEPFASRYRLAYDGEIATADAAVGSLLAELKHLGVYDRAIIVLLSDHGEGLGEHGEAAHGFLLYRDTLQVPLLLKLPGSALAGASVAAPAQLVDVLPTLTALAGVAAPPGLRGQSLLVLLRPEAARTPRPIYSETVASRIHLGWSALTSVVEDRLHLIDGPQAELFDLAADPGESDNVAGAQRRAFAAMRQSARELFRPVAAPRPVDAETAAKLAALGYVAGGAAAAADAERDGDRPDPRTQRQAMKLIESASLAAQERRWADAVPLYQQMLAANPRMVDIYFLLGHAYRHLGHRDDAVRAYQDAFRAAAGSAPAAYGVAQELLQLGLPEQARIFADLAAGAFPDLTSFLQAKVALARSDPTSALAWLRRAGKPAPPELAGSVGVALARAGQSEEALALLAPLAAPAANPAQTSQTNQTNQTSPAILRALGIVLSDGGRNREAVGVLEQAIAADPKDALACQALGIARLRLEQPQEARRQLERALALDPRLPDAWNTLGVVLFQLAGPEPALGAWRRALAIDPQQYEALLNVGLVSAAAGRRGEARQALERFVAAAPAAHFGPDIAKAQALLRKLRRNSLRAPGGGGGG